MRIESLTPETASTYQHELAQLYLQNIRACSHLDRFSLDDARDKIDSLAQHLAKNTCVAYGAFHEDALCGFVWAYPHRFREEPRMYVSEIRVAEDWRNRGIGTQLLECVEDKTRELGIGAIYLHAEADNPDAIRLYESIGYRTERLQLRKELG